MSWGVTAQVAVGVVMAAATPALPVDAAVQILVTVDPGGTDKRVKIQPRAAPAIRFVSGQVQPQWLGTELKRPSSGRRSPTRWSPAGH
jgi:hypothetical protein